VKKLLIAISRFVHVALALTMFAFLSATIPAANPTVASTAMMAMTTSNSTRVKPRAREELGVFINAIDWGFGFSEESQIRDAVERILHHIGYNLAQDMHNCTQISNFLSFPLRETATNRNIITC
jgi:hypothetical protein